MNYPDFYLDKKASELISDAGNWVAGQFNGDCEAIMDRLQAERPGEFKRLAVDWSFEFNYHNRGRDLERLKRELRVWCKSWQRIIKEFRKDGEN